MADALLIAAHGTQDPSGLEEFWGCSDLWQRLRPDRLQAAGFLEFARPTIGEAIDDLVARGARRIVVAPAMLAAAGHVKNDVPSEIAEGRLRHLDITFQMARALEVHPALLELCHIRYREAIAGLPHVPPGDSLLLLVGRGTSDPDANATVARVGRFLWEAYGVAWASVAFSGLAVPGVDNALSVCRRLGYARIIVQPYFLFDGVLVKRIVEAASRHAEADAATQIVTVSHLGPHPLLVEAFEERAHEAIHGLPHMNCDLCKYRVKLISREADLRLPQAGHHHHVRAPLEVPGHDHHRGRPRFTPQSDLSGHPWDARLLERLHLMN